MVEKWRPVARHPNYEVSNFGRVRNIRRNVILNGWICNGYVRINLGRKIKVFVHVLVAEAFLGPCPENQETRHKDGDRGNPRIDNLEYGTRSENIFDAYRHGTRNHSKDKIVAAKARKTKRRMYGENADKIIAQKTVKTKNKRYGKIWGSLGFLGIAYSHQEYDL